MGIKPYYIRVLQLIHSLNLPFDLLNHMVAKLFQFALSHFLYCKDLPCFRVFIFENHSKGSFTEVIQILVILEDILERYLDFGL